MVGTSVPFLKDVFFVDEAENLFDQAFLIRYLRGEGANIFSNSFI